jgi:hypothetical protein
MHKDHTDPVESNKEIAFWGDPVELTRFGNAVTMRKGYEGGDKYDSLKAGDEFDYIVEFEGKRANLGKGVVVAHWKLPFKDVPTEIICGEEFPREFLYPQFRVREEMQSVLQDIYGEFNDSTLSHPFVFVYPDEIYEKIVENFDIDPRFFRNPDLFFSEFLREEYLQREGESPEEWIRRECKGIHGVKTLADLFFGKNASYRALKESRM